LSEHYDYILVQNPPCVPVLMVLYILKLLRLNKAEIIIDWHNYGYSIMRVNRVNKLLVAAAKVYEMVCARCGDHHLCVSRAMQIDLVNKFKIKGSGPHVLYDKATSKFKKEVSVKEMHEVFQRAKLTDKGENKTLFTELDSVTKQPVLRKDRPVFLLSSTSYTPDEDFMVLVNALDMLYSKL